VPKGGGCIARGPIHERNHLCKACKFSSPSYVKVAIASPSCFKYEFLNGQLFSYSYKLFMFNSYLPHYAPCFSFFIGQSTFSRNVCHVQASSNGNNGLRQHCDMAQQWQPFISCIIHSISLGSLFFPSYKSFSSSHTLSFLVVPFFFQSLIILSQQS